MKEKVFCDVKRSTYNRVIKEERPGFEYDFIFSQMLSTCRMQTYLLTLLPKSTSKTTITDGFVFKFIIHGRCEYHIGDEVITLNEGDSLFFDASKPHMPVNKSKGKVTMLVFYFIRTDE